MSPPLRNGEGESGGEGCSSSLSRPALLCRQAKKSPSEAEVALAEVKRDGTADEPKDRGRDDARVDLHVRLRDRTRQFTTPPDNSSAPRRR